MRSGISTAYFEQDILRIKALTNSLTTLDFCQITGRDRSSATVPTVKDVAFRIIWRSVSEIFGVVSDLLYGLRQTGA